MAEKTVAMSERPEMDTRPAGAQTRERYVTPPVDIYEMPEGLVVMAEVPGVTHEHLDVHVDNHVLTIQAQTGHAHPAALTYHEYEPVHYFRQFELNDKVDEGKISADLKHGVLTLTLPKAAAAKARQIAVTVS